MKHNPYRSGLSIECFPFFNELDMLELHLQTTKEAIDLWIIVESDHTFRNTRKDFNFLNNQKRFEEFLPRIHYSVLPSKLHSNPWENERYQRDQLFEELRLLSLNKGENVVFLLDVDEIPSPDTIKLAKGVGIADIDMPLFNYYYNLRVKMSWDAPKILSGDLVDKMTASQARKSRNQHVFPGGWHFSNIMTPEMYRLKHKSFSHKEADREDLLALDKIEHAMKNKLDLFNLGKKNFDPVQVPINTLPQHIQQNRSKYEKFLLPEV